MSAAAPKLKERIANQLAQNSHPWIIGIDVLLVILYIMTSKAASPTAEALIGRTVLFFVSAVGFTGGLLALIMMALMSSADFGKLKDLQVYVILGLLLSTVATGVVVVQGLGLVSFPSSP
jgi:hypothetical protein